MADEPSSGEAEGQRLSTAMQAIYAAHGSDVVQQQNARRRRAAILVDLDALKAMVGARDSERITGAEWNAGTQQLTVYIEGDFLRRVMPGCQPPIVDHLYTL